MRKKEKQLIREKNFTWKTSEEYGRDEKEKRNPTIGIHHGEKWNARKWLFLVILECARLTRSSRLVYATCAIRTCQRNRKKTGKLPRHCRRALPLTLTLHSEVTSSFSSSS
ncbi:hypothetical protein V8G54_028310 [Vigna mungo]|uniref:Uncharacterized protein n=1 Tax=Vigna mungo TaxID=3915 RepID=A0AAQ3MR80_VIGMU